MKDLEQLASLIKTRNAVSGEIAAIIGRPALQGHLGEYIASRIFDIALEESAVRKSMDGRFQKGPMSGRTVNIKWYAKLEGLLDLNADGLPDFYLVLAGPRSPSVSSRRTTLPLVIDAVYLFESAPLLKNLRALNVKIGIATSVRHKFWDEAEVYPRKGTDKLALSEEQKALLSLFRSE